MMPIDNEQRLRRTTIASSRSSPEGRTARVGFVAVICGALLSQACAAAFPVPRPEPIAPHLRLPAAAAEGGAPPTPSRRAPALPEPGGREEVELTSFLAYADARAPVLLVARSTRSRAAAAHAAAAPALPTNPQVSVAVGPRVGLGGTGVDVQASFSQQFFIAGERGLRLNAADRQRDLTDAEIEQLRWAVHCDVHAAFHRALVQRDRALLATRILAFQEEVLRVVERQIRAGETAGLALRLTQAEVAQARQLTVAATQNYLSTRIQLAQLSGWPVGRPPVPVGVVDAPREPPALDALLTIARRQLPALRLRDASVREARSRVALADREAWPQPSVGVQYQREGNPGTEGIYHTVMGMLSIPLPTFQRNQGDRARSRADVHVAEAEMAAALSLLDGQVALARSEVASAARRLQSYGTEVLPRFEENLALLRRSFELGEIDVLALSIGRERFLRIQSDALDAQLDYFVALANLERTVGVDLWPDDHSSEAPQ
jgi:cobalt-zinc-cadmium efflux system outer membrane protein